MKKFISGLLTGVILATTFVTLATNYEAITASFPILINGQNWTTDKPIVTIDGSTYLPLRAIGDALNVTVNWNSEKNQVEIGDTQSIQNEYSRHKPAPLNTVQKYTVKDMLYDYTSTVRVIETFRGDIALKKIKEYDKYTDNPQEDFEYILAKIAVSALSIKDDKALDVNSSKFKCFSKNNEQYEINYVTPPKPHFADTIYAGGNTEGYIVLQVKKDDLEPKLVYGLKYDGSGGIWFNLN